MSQSALKKVAAIKSAVSYFTFLLILWGFYRLLFQLPEEIEELLIKPIVWIGPVLYLVIKKERVKLATIGLTLKNLFPSLYLSLALGAIFVIEAILVNFLKYGNLTFNANIGSQVLLVSFGMSLVTAISEEISFRGYIFTRLWKGLGGEISANLLTTFFWTLIHIPISIFIWKLAGVDLAVYLGLTAVFGFGSAFIFARTGNIFSSILLHVLWQWPIILFR